MDPKESPERTTRTTFLASLAGFAAAGLALGGTSLRKALGTPPDAGGTAPEAPQSAPSRIPINPPAHSVKRRG